ncbi:MAG: hypothetical protein IH926_03685 [Proteobacteria bacterium]|nr:hypothetical protein [Pseudomonadota bacterium]
MAFIAILALGLLPSTANAYGCPTSMAEAQAAIDKVKKDMKGEMSKKMKAAGMAAEMALVHALLDDAKMFLAGAKHNHEKPQGAYDHARAIAKADAALGYARASDMLHFKFMQK